MTLRTATWSVFLISYASWFLIGANITQAGVRFTDHEWMWFAFHYAAAVALYCSTTSMLKQYRALRKEASR